MKTLSLKVLGCAAACAVLTTTRAQTADDMQAVPPPDNSVQVPQAAIPVQQGGDGLQPQVDVQPNVIVVPMPTEGGDAGANFNAVQGTNGASEGGPNTTYRVVPSNNQPNQ